MAGVIHLQYMLLNFILLVWAVWLVRARSSRLAMLAMPLAAGLCYDNAVLALGALLEAGPILLGLNWTRYMLHALFAPLFVLALIDLASRSGAGLLTTRKVRLLIATTLIALIGYGLISLSALTLVPFSSGGAVRYVSATIDPPVIGLALTLIALASGVVIWRVSGWSWIFWAALALLLGSGLTGILGRGSICLVTNALEIVLLGAILACERKVQRVGAERLVVATR
jgi:hypothetical protein